MLNFVNILWYKRKYFFGYKLFIYILGTYPILKSQKQFIQDKVELSINF